VASDYIHPEDEPLALDSKCFELAELGEIPVRTATTIDKVKK
jgi:hypothetical protein